MESFAKNKLKLFQKIYYGNKEKSIQFIRNVSYKETMSILQSRIHENLDSFMTLYKVYNSSVERLMDKIKQSFILDDLYKPVINEAKEYKFDDFNISVDTDALEQDADIYTKEMIANDKMNEMLRVFKELYHNVISVHLTRLRTDSIVNYLKARRDRLVRTIVRPSDEVMKGVIAANIQESIANNPIDF